MRHCPPTLNAGIWRWCIIRCKVRLEIFRMVAASANVNNLIFVSVRSIVCTPQTATKTASPVPWAGFQKRCCYTEEEESLRRLEKCQSRQDRSENDKIDERAAF